MWAKEQFIIWVQSLAAKRNLSIMPITSKAELDGLHFRDGLILFHAEWSGYSYENMSAILTAMETHGPNGQAVAICWHDGFNPEEEIGTLGAICHGYAESVLLSDGRIVAHDYRKPDFEPFLQAIRGQP